MTLRCDNYSGNVAILSLTGVLALIGCASSRVSDPPRTATEQFLLSKAAMEAVEQLSFDVLRGRRVFVDSQYFAASEEKFVLGEIRAKMLLAGVELAPQREEAQVVVEVRSGGVGIDRNDYLLGIPALQVGAGDAAGSGVPLLTPELAILKNRYQTGVASVSYVAYWTKTGEVVASSGPFIGRSLRDDWWYFGGGPRSVGDIAPIRKAQ
ncbi:MAG: hypothetical protein H7210_12230 [Pyrinomonadaceae bacterium]|nr:hypothetical protein [Phycisphaerales bacterium]